MRHAPDVVDGLRRAQGSWTLPVSEVKNYIITVKKRNINSFLGALFKSSFYTS